MIISKIFFYVFLCFVVCIFLVRTLQHLKKKQFWKWKHKKTALKSSILMAVWIFSLSAAPHCPKWLRIEFSYRKCVSLVSRHICSLMCVPHLWNTHFALVFERKIDKCSWFLSTCLMELLRTPLKSNWIVNIINKSSDQKISILKRCRLECEVRPP